jgi:hypothetical protein
MKLLSFYTANHSNTSPKIDGTLNDPAWAKARVHDKYYVYFKPNPGPGKLKTTLRMLWNAQGLFIGITNFDSNMEKIKAVHTTKDSNKLWTDDCAEIYFDPNAESVGFTKFTVNALGTLSDMRRIDASVSLPSWSASGVEVKTSRNKESWIIEMFIPWSDLGTPPQNGTLWKFCHVRYAWSSGKFVGVTSSPGGNYNNTGDFGFLYFADGEPAKIKKIGELLKKKAPAPWSLPIQNSLLVYEDGKLTCDKLKKIFTRKQTAAKKRISFISAFLGSLKAGKGASGEKSSGKLFKSSKFNECARQMEKLSAIANPTFNEIRKMDELNSRLDEMSWNLKLQKLMED